jgi:hypothetical protein
MRKFGSAGGQGSGAQGDDCIVVDSSSDDDIQIVSVTAGKQPGAGNRAAASTLQLSRAAEAIRRGEPALRHMLLPSYMPSTVTKTLYFSFPIKPHSIITRLC